MNNKINFEFSLKILHIYGKKLEDIYVVTLYHGVLFDCIQTTINENQTLKLNGVGTIVENVWIDLQIAPILTIYTTS